MCWYAALRSMLRTFHPFEAPRFILAGPLTPQRHILTRRRCQWIMYLLTHMSVSLHFVLSKRGHTRCFWYYDSQQ